MANKIRKFNGYHYIRATKEIEVEDSVHAATFEKGDSFLVGNIKGKYYLVDVDLDEKEAYRYLISEKVYTKFIEQEHILQPTITRPNIVELVKELIADRELKVDLDDYPEVLAFVNTSGLKKRKQGKTVTFKITDSQARIATSMLKRATKDSKTDQNFNNMHYIKPKSYENLPKEAYFKLYLEHVKRMSGRKGSKYSSHDAVVDSQQQDLLDSHPLAGSKALKTYLAKHAEPVEPEVDTDFSDIDKSYQVGKAGIKRQARLDNYQKQLDQLSYSPIYANASEKQLEEARREISARYNPDHVMEKTSNAEISPKDVFYNTYDNEFHNTYLKGQNISFEVKENDKSLFINLPKIRLMGAPLMTYEEPLRELVEKLKRMPELNAFSPKLYVGYNPFPNGKTFHLRLFLFKK